MYLYIKSATAGAAALCCYTAVGAAAAAAVRRRVPEAKNCCWLIESDSSQWFLCLQTRFIFNVCTPWQCCRIYGLDFCLYIYPR